MLFVQSTTLDIELAPESDVTDFVNGDSTKKASPKKSKSVLASDPFAVDPASVQLSDVLTEDELNNPEYLKALDNWSKKMNEWENACVVERIEHSRELSTLRSNLVDLDKEVEDRRLALKEANSERKECLNELIDKEKAGPQLPEKPQKPELKKTVSKSGETTLKLVKPSINEDTTWRKIPTSEVLAEEIKGLGEKKRETILDLYPTLGDLEDLRGEASKQFKHFSKLLPEGIGTAMADKIEDAMEVVKLRHSAKLAQESNA